MYYIYSRKSHKLIYKTADMNELKLFSAERFEVVIY